MTGINLIQVETCVCVYWMKWRINLHPTDFHACKIQCYSLSFFFFSMFNLVSVNPRMYLLDWKLT